MVFKAGLLLYPARLLLILLIVQLLLLAVPAGRCRSTSSRRTFPASCRRCRRIRIRIRIGPAGHDGAVVIERHVDRVLQVLVRGQRQRQDARFRNRLE